MQAPPLDALTINEAAETTGWSARMLRYIERIGLVRAARSTSGYRLYGPAELQRLRTLRELLDGFDLGLGEVGFALRLRREPRCARRSRRGSPPSRPAPSTCPATTGCASSRTSTRDCFPPPTMETV